jgi:general secretion pathway protein D
MPWWRQMVDRFDRPEPVRTEQYVPRRFGLEETAALIEEVVHGGLGAADPGWRMVTDELTGTLIITASPTEHVEIQALLDRLEGTELGPRKPLRAFTLKNRQVSEVLALLQGLLDAGVLAEEQPVTGSESADTAVRGATAEILMARPPPRAVQGEIGTSPVSLAADEGSNRILAFGPASLLDQVGMLVETLDVRNAQVLVETLVVVLNEDETKALGVELQGLRAEGDAQIGLASLFGLGSPNPTSLALPAATGAGFSTTVLDPGDFSAVVRALETLTEGRSLTIPKVLVNNNAQATLDSTLQTPYASTNASTTVATTSFGGTFDAGTAISVKPQVADGDLVVIEYSVSLSRFTGESADPTLPPPRQETKLQSVVTVPDGHTIVIGGLEIESESDRVSEVPILGDLPIVEHLFQDRSRIQGKSRFYVFLKCTVMRSQSFEDLKYESGEIMAAVDVDDGWPKLEPRVIR